MVKPIEVKVVKVHLAPVVDHLDGEGGAGDVRRYAHASRNALGELGLPRPQVSREHQHIALAEKPAQHAPKGDSLLLRRGPKRRLSCHDYSFPGPGGLSRSHWPTIARSLSRSGCQSEW